MAPDWTTRWRPGIAQNPLRLSPRRYAGSWVLADSRSTGEFDPGAAAMASEPFTGRETDALVGADFGHDW